MTQPRGLLSSKSQHRANQMGDKRGKVFFRAPTKNKKRAVVSLEARIVPAAAAGESSKPEVGRNDTCPCGSGKKHKRCCG